MDPSTDDQRAWTLAPHLVVVSASPEVVSWLAPETGTTCQLEANGDYVVLRRVGERVTPVVAGQLLVEQAAAICADPDSVTSRRAAAHAIVAVDEAVHDR